MGDSGGDVVKDVVKFGVIVVGRVDNLSYIIDLVERLVGNDEVIVLG